MLKKFKQKKQLLLASLIAIISINLVGFLPIFVSDTSAQIRGVEDCKITSSDVTSSSVRVNKYKVDKTETFEIYAEMKLSASARSACNTAGKDNYQFSYFVYQSQLGQCYFSLQYNYRATTTATPFNDNNGFAGFRHKLTGASIDNFFKGSSVTIDYGDKYCVYAYYHNKTEAPTSDSRYLSYDGSNDNSGGKMLLEQGAHQLTDTLPAVESTDWKDLVVNNTEERAKADELSLTIKPDSSGKGLRSKYRVAVTDTAITFGADKGPDAIYADWAEGSKRIGFNQYIGIPYDSKSTIQYDYSPQFKHVKMYFANASKEWDPKAVCWKDSANYILNANDDCSKIVYDGDTNGSPSDPTKGTKGLLAGTFDPTMKSGIWSQFSSKTAAEGQPLGTVDVYLVPIAWGENSGGWKKSYVLAKSGLKKVTLEVFKTDKDIIAACKADASITDKTKCDDLQFAKYGFASTVTQTSTSSETADKGVGQSLYAFILKVITFIVIGLTTIIYKIFSFVLVPVLNALIRIRPFQDQFVNVIYPGWIILRNLANIAFIIALLVMGLRVLFQQDDPGKTRTFMVKLILMALLVNFSLVIAQGIVAIADTVQSQFLPGDTRVIEALAVKLMVDPINEFQGATASPDVELAAADVFKPVMLLLTSLAAFFAFAAVAAFIAVRTVALWVFYLTSPVAYFGQVLPGVQKFASQWWEEFIKYVITVPVLVFFLNIAALMATTFSRQQGNAVNVEANNDYLLGGVAAGVTGFAFTVITQAVVLIFLFAGMKVAISIGPKGSKAIVDYAKKGFDWASQTAPKAVGGWAKDTAGDWAAGKAEDKGWKKLATGIRAAARPIEAGKAFKKGYFDKPREVMNKRFADDFDKRAKQLQPWGEDKLFPAKLAYWKLTGQSAKRTKGKAEQLREQAGMLTDSDLADLKMEEATQGADLAAFRANYMNTAEGRKYVNDMTEKRNVLQDELKGLQDNKTKADGAGDTIESARLAKEITDKQDEIRTLDGQRSRVDGAVTVAEHAGATKFDFSGLENDFKAVVDVKELEKAMAEALSDTTMKVKEEDDLRSKYGVSSMSEARKKSLEAEADKLVKLSQSREGPASKDVQKEHDAEVAKAKKEIAELDLDYDQLEQGTLKALKDNNDIQAKAYFKQMAENGQLKKFLEARGEKYNLQGLEKFVKENLKGRPRDQITFIRDVSKAAGKNGNLPLGFAVKNLAGGTGYIKDYKTQMADVKKEFMKKQIKDVKEDDISHIDPRSGKQVATPGMSDWVRAYNTTEKAKQIRREMNPKVAQAILTHMSKEDMKNYKEAVKALTERAALAPK